MKTFQNRLSKLEEKHAPKSELCIAFLWVRKDHEKEDVQRQIQELKEVCKDLPSESFYQIFALDAPNESYDSFTEKLRKECTLEQWWKRQTIRGEPHNDYSNASEKWKRI